MGRAGGGSLLEASAQVDAGGRETGLGRRGTSPVLRAGPSRWFEKTFLSAATLLRVRPPILHRARPARRHPASDGAGTETAGASAVTVLPPAPEARRSPPEEETYLLRRLVDAAADSNRRSLQIEKELAGCARPSASTRFSSRATPLRCGTSHARRRTCATPSRTSACSPATSPMRTAHSITARWRKDRTRPLESPDWLPKLNRCRLLVGITTSLASRRCATGPPTSARAPCRRGAPSSFVAPSGVRRCRVRCASRTGSHVPPGEHPARSMSGDDGDPCPPVRRHGRDRRVRRCSAPPMPRAVGLMSGLRHRDGPGRPSIRLVRRTRPGRQMPPL